MLANTVKYAEQSVKIFLTSAKVSSEPCTGSREGAHRQDSPYLLQSSRPASSLSLGLVLCYAFGTAWFLRVYTGEVTLAKALSWCVWPFILPDLVKLVLAMAVGRRVKRALGAKI